MKEVCQNICDFCFADLYSDQIYAVWENGNIVITINGGPRRYFSLVTELQILSISSLGIARFISEINIDGEFLALIELY